MRLRSPLRASFARESFRRHAIHGLESARRPGGIVRFPDAERGGEYPAYRGVYRACLRRPDTSRLDTLYVLSPLMQIRPTRHLGAGVTPS